MDGSVEAKSGYTLAHDFASYVKYIVTCSPATFEERYLNDTFDCGGTKYDTDWNLIPEHRIRQKYEAVLDELGLSRYCCRSIMLGHVELIDEIAKFRKY